MLTGTNLSVTRSDADGLSLFSGVDDAINRAFGITSHRHKSKFREVIEAIPKSFNDVDFVESVFQIMADNWERCVLQNRHKPPSAENWRWFDPKPNFDNANPSLEVVLERKLIKACLNFHREDWSNQVPVASGLTGPRSYKRKAIDLVHRRGPTAFDFVELKVGSDNPLYAAMEILQYGVVWLLSRRDRARLVYLGKAIIEANDVRLVVLAPEPFFEGRAVGKLGTLLNRGLAALGQKFAVTMGFCFQALPATLEWPGEYSPKELTTLLDARRCVSAWNKDPV